MTEFIGTTLADILSGSADSDTFISYGTGAATDWDTLIGGDGGDVYDLRRGDASFYNFIIDDQGGDGAIDTMINVGRLYQSASLGYQAWASVERIDDDLIIDTPSKPHRFRDPAEPSYHIEVKDHFAGAGVEFMVSGGVTYALAAGDTGSDVADIVAGARTADRLTAKDGDDWVFGNNGKDTLLLGNGDDTGFGGRGQDTIRGHAGNDRLDGGDGGDRLYGGSGHDQVIGGNGNDRLAGGSGNDRLQGDAGNDKLYGGAGQDNLNGGAGDDFMSGGKDGDVYRIAVGSETESWGHDSIRDNGNPASWNNKDIIELAGYYGPSSGSSSDAYARLHFTREGDDMLLSSDNGLSTLRVERMFHADADRYFIEELQFNAGYWTELHFQILDGAATDIGDDRSYSVPGYTGDLNEILFGTDGNDQIFGNSGTNFIWTGQGADVLVYKENDPQILYGYGGGLSLDIVEDFDITNDRLDFSEINGLTLASLSIAEDAGGDATVYWNSGDFEISSIYIELRDVAMDDVTADLFIF